MLHHMEITIWKLKILLSLSEFSNQEVKPIADRVVTVITPHYS